MHQNSDYLRNHEWLWEEFPPDIRFHSVILTGDNMLSRAGLLQLLRIHRLVEQTTSPAGAGWQDQCYK